MTPLMVSVRLAPSTGKRVLGTAGDPRRARRLCDVLFNGDVGSPLRPSHARKRLSAVVARGRRGAPRDVCASPNRRARRNSRPSGAQRAVAVHRRGGTSPATRRGSGATPAGSVCCWTALITTRRSLQKELVYSHADDRVEKYGVPKHIDYVPCTLTRPIWSRRCSARRTGRGSSAPSSTRTIPSTWRSPSRITPRLRRRRAPAPTSAAV